MATVTQIISLEGPHLIRNGCIKKLGERNRVPSQFGKTFTAAQVPNILPNFDNNSASSMNRMEVGFEAKKPLSESPNHHKTAAYGLTSDPLVTSPNKRTPRAGRFTGKGPFTCIQCGKVFKSPQIWKIHILNHKYNSKLYTFGKSESHEVRDSREEKSFLTSVVCNPQKIQPPYLLDETLAASTKAKTNLYGCNDCCRYFSSKKALEFHISCHTGEKQFHCDKNGCEAEFAHFSSLQRHMKSHKLAPSRKNRINQCKVPKIKCNERVVNKERTEFRHQKFNIESKVRASLQTDSNWCYHSCEDEVSASNPYATRLNQAKLMKIAHQVNTCSKGKNFNSEEQHKPIPQKNTINDDGNSFKTKVLILQANLPIVKTVCLDHLHADITSKRSKKVQADPRPYKCKEDGCDAAYAHAGSLWNHTASIHHGRDIYRSKSKLKNLSIHKNKAKQKHKNLSKSNAKQKNTSTFTKTRKELCKNTESEKVFASSQGLKFHANMQRGSKPYKCRAEGCKAAFSYRGALANHTKYLHSEEEQFKCQYCTKAFWSRTYLRKHVGSIHTNTDKMFSSACSVPTISYSTRPKRVRFKKCGCGSSDDETETESEWHSTSQKGSSDAKTGNSNILLKSSSHSCMGVEPDDNFQQSICTAVQDYEVVELVKDKENQSQDGDLQQQGYVHRAEEAFSFLCELCSAEFNQCIKYIDHVASHAKEIESFDIVSTIPNETTMCQYICGQCRSWFKNRKRLHKHLLSHAAERD